MIYIKEFFDFFKSKTPNTWQEKFDYVYNTFLDYKKKDKDNKIHINIDLKEDSFIISTLDLKKKYKENVSLAFSPDKVLDLNDCDYSDFKSKIGTYEITKNQFDNFYKKAKEISDWLDEKSEKNLNKSGSSVSDSGFNLDINEYDLNLEDLNDKLKSEIFKKYLGKDFEFEFGYNLIPNEKDKIIYLCERYDLHITDIKVGFRSMDQEHKVYINVFCKNGIYNKSYFFVEFDSHTNYFNLEKKPFNLEDALFLMEVEPELSRKAKREYNSKYPKFLTTLISPCKYNSIEFIKELVEVLQQLMEMSKKLK
jgi:hypothetical protein